jgi:catechol 2,3-dioxygenase-like lactoylglutathione lyase family enzyme
MLRRHNTRDPDHEKTVALVRDLPRARALYERVLTLQPLRPDATLAYCALLQVLVYADVC